MTEVVYIAPVRVSADGVASIDLSSEMMEALGWSKDDDLEWTIVRGGMAIVRKMWETTCDSETSF